MSVKVRKMILLAVFGEMEQTTKALLVAGIGGIVVLLCLLSYTDGRRKSIGPISRTCYVCGGHIFRGCMFYGWNYERISTYC